jgi:GT2 family glycosyltransferase
MGTLGTVIVTYRSDAVLPGLLADLERYEPESTVTVVDHWADADPCARIRKAGGRIMMLPSIPIVHIEGISKLERPSHQRWEWYLEGGRLFVHKHLIPWRARLFLTTMGFGRLLGRADWRSLWSRR